jgi:hypothetical protein
MRKEQQELEETNRNDPDFQIKSPLKLYSRVISLHILTSEEAARRLFLEEKATFSLGSANT